MIIRVREIPNEGRDFEFVIKSPTVEGFEESPKVQVKVLLEGKQVQIIGSVSGVLNTECSRCGDDFKLPLSTSFGMFLKPSDPKFSNFKLEEDVGYGLYDGHEFDCAEIANEALVLAIPFAPLCSDGCLGICLDCGANLNTEICKCKLVN